MQYFHFSIQGDVKINTLKKLNQVIEPQKKDFNITERFSYKFDKKTGKLILKYTVLILKKVMGCI